MATAKEYKIPFTGLKLGNHSFRFELGNTFFESFEYSEIEQSSCIVDLNLEKQSTMLVLTFQVSGSAILPCDRCTDEMDVDLEGEYNLVVKFSDEDVQDSEEIIFLPTSEYQVDVERHLYEFVHLSLPSKRVHEEGECNTDMLDALDEYLVHEDMSSETDEDSDSNDDGNEDVDPRWAALKDLK